MKMYKIQDSKYKFIFLKPKLSLTIYILLKRNKVNQLEILQN